MPGAAVGAQIDEPLDVHRDFLAEFAFHPVLTLNHFTDTSDLVLREVLRAGTPIDLRLREVTWALERPMPYR